MKWKNDALVNPKTVLHYSGLCHCVGTFTTGAVGIFLRCVSVTIILLTAVHQCEGACFCNENVDLWQ